MVKMNLRQLEAFRAVILAGSVTEASRILNISQPSVSRLIADLERSFGFKLFLRRKGRLMPTPEALSFHEELERSFLGMDTLAQVVEEIRSFRRDHLRIAAMPALCLEVLPRAVKVFQDRHPGLRITLEVHSSQRTVDWIAAQRFDLGLAQLWADRPSVETVMAFPSRCVCILPRGHRLEEKQVLTPSDLRNEPFIALAQRTLAGLQMERVFSDANIRRDIRSETLISFAACSLVAEGAGVAIVDPYSAEFYRNRNIAIRPFEPPISFDFKLLRPMHTVPSRTATAFVAHVAEYLNTATQMG